LRFFNFYGPKLDFIGQGRVMTCFLEKFLKGYPVEVVEPGDQTRCFTYIDDGIEGVLRVAHMPEAEGKAFNLGLPVETSMIELAKLMKKIGNFDSEIIIIPAEKKYGKGYDDIYRRVPDCSRAKEILGWEASIPLEDGLRRTIEYFKKLHNY
jgi:UDP-glucose 4-epimerase